MRARELAQPAAAQQLVVQARQAWQQPGFDPLMDLTAAAADGTAARAGSHNGGAAVFGGRGCTAPVCDGQHWHGAKAAGDVSADRGAVPAPLQQGEHSKHKGKGGASSMCGVTEGPATAEPPDAAAFAFKFF